MIRYRVQCWVCGDTEFFRKYGDALGQLQHHTILQPQHVVTLERIEATAEELEA